MSVQIQASDQRYITPRLKQFQVTQFQTYTIFKQLKKMKYCHFHKNAKFFFAGMKAQETKVAGR
jgi:hypothetical protein